MTSFFDRLIIKAGRYYDAIASETDQQARLGAIEERERLLQIREQLTNETPDYWKLAKLTHSEKIKLLEAMLIKAAGDGEDTSGIIEALKILKAGDAEAAAKRDRTHETEITHRYRIPVLNELGSVIGTARDLILLSLMAASIGLIWIGATNGDQCRDRLTKDGEIENKSALCEGNRAINRFFDDWQPKPKQ